MGGTNPPHLLPDHDWSKIVQDYIKTIPTFIAFLKLLLGHVKVKIMLISWYFLVVFWMCLHPLIDWDPHFLVNERCWGGTYLGQVWGVCDLQFQSFQILNVIALLRPTSYTPIFGQTKGPIEIHKRGKFHQSSICRCQVIYLQRFSK